MPLDQVSRVLGPVLSTIVRQAFARPPRVGIASRPVNLKRRINLPGSDDTLIGRSEIKRLVRGVSALVTPLRGVEFADLDAPEWSATLEAVSRTLAGHSAAPAGRLGVQLILKSGLRPDTLYEEFLQADPDRVSVAGLNNSAIHAYHRLLRQCAIQLVEFVASREQFLRVAQAETIRRLADLDSDLEALRKSQPEISPAEAGFERRYRERTAVRLNQLRLFGVTVKDHRPYPLSTAYLSLEVSRRTADGHADGGRPVGSSRTNETLRIDEVLSGAKRLLIRGEAGSGKTTLLQWLAVALATEAPHVPAGWAGGIPFLIPLRRYNSGELPVPEEFPRETALALRGEMPRHWVHKVLSTRAGVVLIDGVDELPEHRREEVRAWLQDLVGTFPTARYVVTSRPPSAPGAWLASEDFDTFTLMPMTQPDIHQFVHYWHNAMREIAPSDEDRTRLDDDERDLVDQISRSRSLRQLATNPLLCALICTLHNDRLRNLPRDRKTLYRAALEMLLVRRDRDRRVTTIDITQDQQEELLARLAYWMLRNRRIDVDRLTAEARISDYARNMHIKLPSSEVLNHLVVRSGVLCEPVEGRIDFMHRTFQDFLAAHAVLDEGDVEALIANAHDEAWRDTVVMAAGLGRLSERNQLIGGICDRADSETEHQRWLSLLAAACVDLATSVEAELEDRVRQHVALVMRPQTIEQATELTAVGEIILDLIPDVEDLSTQEIQWLVHAVRNLGGDDSLPVLARLGRSGVPHVQADLAANWPDEVTPEAYVNLVLTELDNADITFRVRDRRQLSSVARVAGIRRLRLEGITDDLDTIPFHRNLEVLEIHSGAVPTKSVLRKLPTLTELRVINVERPFDVPGTATAGLRSLILLDSATLNAGDLKKLRNLQSFVFDTRVGHSMELLHVLPRLSSLGVLSGASMADCLDVDQRWATGVEISDFVQKHKRPAWLRPGLYGDVELAHVKELSVSGWLSEEELRWLRARTGVHTLRVIVPTDDARGAFKAADMKDYPYPKYAEGVHRLLSFLPYLRTLRLCLLEPVSQGRSGVVTAFNHALSSIQIRAQAAATPSTSPLVNVIVNGIRIDRSTS